jgi:hypothetical protein
MLTRRSRTRRYRSSVRAMLVILATAAVCAVAAQSAGAGAASAAAPLHATFVGDSVSASILYTASAQRRLEKGVDVRLDLKVCRRLVQPSCPYQGSVPSTALQAVQSYGHALGKVLIVKVGYNESASGYGQGIDRVMRAALAEGATGVVWVTLRETTGTYRWTNVAIRQATKRWPQLVVADWNAYSSGKPWFSGDGLHLNSAGATGLATFLRPYLFRAAATA